MPTTGIDIEGVKFALVYRLSLIEVCLECNSWRGDVERISRESLEQESFLGNLITQFGKNSLLDILM